MVQIAEDRPPYVQFELRAVEDRSALIETGHYGSKDVAFALITPAGSKDRVERNAEEWLEHIRTQVEEERFPAAWYRAYRDSFEDWKKGNEPVLEGTDVRNWPAASPAQVKAMLNWNIRTVEDMAKANEETLRRLGMGAMALKERAQEWLSVSSTKGKIAEQIASLRAEMADLKNENASLREKLQKAVKESELKQGT